MIKLKSLAVVGIGCRLPGGINSPEEFWQLLCEERDAIVPVPEARWDVRKYYDENPYKPGKSYVKEGGFLHHQITDFDADFFNITPREAMTVDPQQRLLLEASWEAIEDSGMPLEALQKLRTGVFVGGFCLDSMLIQLNPKNKEIINSFTSAGITLCILSNRISHAFDLTGPSMSIDTACSSSLVATHLACQSIWSGDADIALIGGVNVMLQPEYFVGMSKGRFLSPRARCHAFDSRADGYARGEGCGVVLIKPLEQAIENGDRIYSVILGTGVNQDGRTAGISLPNSAAQEKLIRYVYDRAGVSPEDIHYIEAHGTGTQQGDYAEAMALDRVFQNKQGQCLLGSVKTNIGHLEAAAGVAGLIKTSLALYHAAVPANLHFKNPNEKIPFERLKVKVSDHYQALPETATYHYAGVNSFGYGGTNAHVVLRSETSSRKASGVLKWPIIYPLSARGTSALKALAVAHQDLLQTLEKEEQLADILYTLTEKSTAHDCRLAVIGKNEVEVKKGLSDFIEGKPSAHVIFNKVSHLPKRLVWVYTGMGPQWWGMGQQLYRESPIFVRCLEKCDSIFKRISGWSLTEELLRGEQESKIARADVAQPLNFVIQIGLTEILKVWGVVPDAVVGHSVGEISAAYVAGALSLEDALLVSYHRSRLQQTCAGKGAMLAANISVQHAQKFLKQYKGVAVAAVNGAEAITLAGDRVSLEEIAAQLSEEQFFNRTLKVDVAYHSPEMEPIKEELLSVLKPLNQRNTSIPLYSAVTGQLIEGEKLDADYWWKNVRQSVLFKDAIDALLEKDFFNVLVEIGPHPVTQNYLKERLEKTKKSGFALFSLHREKEETMRQNILVAELHSLGCRLSWRSLLPEGGNLTSLPKYPWQRQKYWLEGDQTESDRCIASEYLFLAKKLECPRPSWEIELNDQFFPYVPDHCLEGRSVFPGAGFVEAALQLAHVVNPDKLHALRDIRFEQMLLLEKEKIQKIVSEYDPVHEQFTIWSTEYPAKAWRVHAKAKIHSAQENLGLVNVEALKARCTEVVNPALIYELFAKEGLQYGPQFQGVHRLWHNGKDEILAELHLPQRDTRSKYFIHPVILDSAFHSLMALENDLSSQSPYVPVKIGAVFLGQHVSEMVWAHTQVVERDEHTIRENILLIDDSGKVVARIDDFVCQRLTAQDSSLQLERLAKHLYQPAWQKESFHFSPAQVSETAVLVFAQEPSSLCEALLEELALNYCAPLALEGDVTEEKIQQLLAGKTIKNLLCIYLAPGKHSSLPETKDYEALLDSCMTLTELAKFLQKAAYSSKRLVILTQNAKLIEKADDGANRAAAALSSVGFLMNNEVFDLKAKTIDLPFRCSDLIIENCVLEMLSTNEDIDVALRENARYVMRMQPQVLDLSDVSLHPPISSEGCYLITGGTSGFGLELAKTLVVQGAKHIVLVSRRGLSNDYARHTVAKLRRHSVEVEVRMLDISDEEAVFALIQSIHCDAHPLKGVFHCAMVLEDALMITLTADDYARVMKPKVLGTLYLHKATQEILLDYFVMTSSIASLVGNTGQANYIAANAYIDHFVHYRRKKGLAATVLNIGVLADVGVIARSGELSRYTDLLAITKTPVDLVIQVLLAMLFSHQTVLAIMEFDWVKWEKMDPKSAHSSRFDSIIREAVEQKTTEGANGERDRLLALLSENPEESVEMLSLLVKNSVAEVLRTMPDKIDVEANLNYMWLDSLMVSELRNRLISEFDVEMSLVELLKGISVKEIAQLILTKLTKS